MPDIVDAKANINDVEVDADAALSEALFEKIGGAINYLNTTTDTHTTQISALQNIELYSTTISHELNPANTSEATFNNGTVSSVVVPSGGKVLIHIGEYTSSSQMSGSFQNREICGALGLSLPSTTVTMRLKRDSTNLIADARGISGSASIAHIRGSLFWVDSPSAGTYNYSLTYQSTSTSATVYAYATIVCLVIP